MLTVNQLHKNIVGRPILTDINFQTTPGSITGIIGENGAGKTTLLKLISGILRPSSGGVLYKDMDVFNNHDVRHDIAFVTEEADFFKYARVKDIVNFMNDVYNHFDEQHFHALNQIFQIPLDTKIQKLSKGMRMKVSLMVGLGIRPKLLLLDEPTTGLDPMSRKNLFRILMDEVAQNQTSIIISSHLLNDLEQICDHIIMIRDGKIISNSSLESLKSSIRQIQVCFNNHIPAGLSEIPGIMNIKTIGRVAYLTINGDMEDVTKILETMDILFWEPIDLKLEDIFITTNKVGETDVENFKASAV
ncbi:ABC transporter ATP-binding protein [Fusibacter sp. JL216-2]|uniref:ABC transporter ATP-binding protein n=1 Tax=Fusibacter sp. JL216-2 TaxID=3071453 RepID=UPI003D335611